MWHVWNTGEMQTEFWWETWGKETTWKSWFALAQDRDRWLALVNALMELGFHKKRGFLTSWGIVSWSGRTPLHGVFLNTCLEIPRRTGKNLNQVFWFQDQNMISEPPDHERGCFPLDDHVVSYRSFPHGLEWVSQRAVWRGTVPCSETCLFSTKCRLFGFCPFTCVTAVRCWFRRRLMHLDQCGHHLGTLLAWRLWKPFIRLEMLSASTILRVLDREIAGSYGSELQDYRLGRNAVIWFGKWYQHVGKSHCP